MERIALARDVLAEVTVGSAAAARARALAAGGSLGHALAGIAAFWVGDFAEAGRHGLEAEANAADSAERALSLGVCALAGSGDPLVPQGDPVGEAIQAYRAWVEDGIAAEDADLAVLVAYVVTEAALVSARLKDAAEIAPAMTRESMQIWAGQPIEVMMTACAVRLAVFRGRIDEATDLVDAMRRAARGSRLEAVAGAVDCLVLGNADSADAMALRGQIDAAIPTEPRDWVDRGALLLLAFGAIAVGDVAGAAASVFRAGGDGGLTNCTLIDRALGLELLLVAALDADDIDAASVWAGRLAEIADHPITAPTVDRALARLALTQGAGDEAVRRLERSVAACQEQERLVEVAEGEIVLARARIATHDVAGATRGLRTLVAAADSHGHAAVRRSASIALGTARRRLPPVAGGGWAVLTEREREVAHRILAGERTEQIAAALFLSPHTVRVHTSRVLCAFGAASRVGLLTTAGPLSSAADLTTPLPADLSPRQGEVTRLVATGLSNGAIAAELGISVKAVEKHVADVRMRWRVATRFDVARLWLTTQEPDPA